MANRQTALRRRRLLAGALVPGWLAATVLLPALHQARHDAAHRHPGALDPPAAATHVDAEHEVFDADLAALELSDAGHFGITTVDCALAGYTLAACDQPGQAEHSFGDELIARSPHRHAPPFDPRHGAGSLEHFGLALLAPPPVLLAPPPRPAERITPLLVAERGGFSIALPLRSRAPPA